MTDSAESVEKNLTSAMPAEKLSKQVDNGDVNRIEQQVLPLHQEELAVARRRVDQAVVRVATTTQTREVIVDEQLTHEHVEVERIPIGQVIETMPPVREEGDVTIIPVVEEIVVIERRLVLKEEVHLRRVRVTEQYLQTVTVREQDAVVTRSEIGS